MIPPLTRTARWGVLATAILALLFDGVELGLMPVASLSVSKSLLGAAYTPTLGGDWFARFTAALMLGAAVGGRLSRSFLMVTFCVMAVCALALLLSFL